jgi:DNA polymerase III epsilon subunit-like protein
MMDTYGMNSRTIYFDLETGGVEPRHPNIQLAAICVDDSTGQELGSLECKIKFDESEADPEALALNHYTKEAWVDAVSYATAAARYAAFVKPHSTIEMISKRNGAPYMVAKLAGYNALTFDLPRLKNMFGATFFPCSYLVRDILQRAMFWFDEHPEVKNPGSLKLSKVCEHFGITVDGAHDALVDVRLTASLHRKLAGL